MLGRQHLLCFSLLMERQANHCKGVAMAMSKPTGKQLESFQPINSRLEKGINQSNKF